MEENLGAAEVELTPQDLDEINGGAERITIHGHRYSESAERMVDR